MASWSTDTMGVGMIRLQYASCLDNSNHTGAGCALLPIWTLCCCQSAQEILRYPSRRHVSHCTPFSCLSQSNAANVALEDEARLREG